MKTFHTFKDAETFQKFLREKYGKCHVSGFGCLDYVSVFGRVYTMHEYDSEGKMITWANKKNESMIELETFDRYKFGYGDSKIMEYKPFGFRNDISYAE